MKQSRRKVCLPIEHQQAALEPLEPRLLLSGSDPYALMGPGPLIVQDTEGQDAIFVYGAASATVEPWAGGQLLRVQQEADSDLNEFGGTVYESLFVDVMLSGPGGALGTAAPLDLSGAERMEASARGTVGALLLGDADGDLFGYSAMSMGTGMIPGAFERYEALLDPASWTLLGGGGNGALDLSSITEMGIRVTNESDPGLMRAPTIDVAIHSIGASRGMAPDPVIWAFYEDFEAAAPNGYLQTGGEPAVIPDTEGEAAVFVYGGPVETAIESWVGGQVLHVSGEADSYVDEMGDTAYEPMFVDVMLSGPGGALGAAGSVNLSGAERLETFARGTAAALLLQDADGDLFAAPTMSMGTGMIPGAFERYEVMMDPMSWTLLGGGGDGALDLSSITEMGLRVTNDSDPGMMMYGPTLDVSIDSIGASSGMAPDPLVWAFRESFDAKSPDGYAATGAAPAVLQDTEGQDAVHIYGSPASATIEPWVGGQMLRVQADAAMSVNEMGVEAYESLFVDVMLSGPGGTLGAAAPINLSSAERLEASVRGSAAALLLRDADGDVFGSSAMSMGTAMIPGAFERHEAMLDPASWTLLGGGGDGALDLSSIAEMGVRVTNETRSGSMEYGPTLDVSVHSIGASRGMAPDPVIWAFHEDFEAAAPNGYVQTAGEPAVIPDTEDQAAVSVYGGPVETTIESWVGGQVLHVYGEADSSIDSIGDTVYEPMFVDVMLSGPGGALGAAGSVNLSGAERLEAFVRGTAAVLLLQDADGDLFAAPTMYMGTSMIPGAFERYEALLDPMTWTLLSRGGNGALDLWVITGIGVRVTNESAPGMGTGPTLDASIDSIGASSGMAPDPIVRSFYEDFGAAAPDGYTGEGPVVLQDSEGREAAYVYGVPEQVVIEPWAGGQLLHLQKEASSYTTSTGTMAYEALFVDVILSGPGGELGAAAPLDLSGAERVEASVRGKAGALLLQDADGDVFGAPGTSMGWGMIPGAFERYEAPLDPMTWTLLGRGGDGTLDLSAVTRMGVRATNQDPYGAMMYGPTLDVSIDSISASSGVSPDPVVRVFCENFESLQLPPEGIPGDANGDGAVTDADYTIWADNYGAAGATFAQGDFNGDGSVTDADYTLWADNYGAGATDTAATTQESTPVTTWDEPVETASAQPGRFGRALGRAGVMGPMPAVDALKTVAGESTPDETAAASLASDLLAILSVPEVL